MRSVKIATFLFVAFALNFTSVYAQDKKDNDYEFTPVKRLDATSVKDQHRSGTCWSFSAISFLESEMLRMGKEPVNLSEMWIVRHAYSDKAKKYVRFHGNLNFAGGGAFHDVTNMMKENGIVPEEAYPGLKYGTDQHVHGELDAVLKGYVDAVLKNRNRELTPVWHDGFDKLLDSYLGKQPETFTYEGNEYTPKSFAKEYVGVNPDDYVELSSYTHHPFYSQFILEVPDNWSYDRVYNLPVDELMEVMYNSVEQGYTIAWASDVSEKGFSWKNGVAVVPEKDLENLQGTEKSRWEDLTEEERQKMLYSFNGPVPEKTITQEMRQEAFNNWNTTDDHGMHITGIAKDQNGKKYFIVKNSWAGEDHIYDGYFYASDAFVRYKTMDIMVHKDAIPEDIAKKLGLQE
ncbi:MAG TPA: C1 family peptidase [Bacteroidales bacterium]|nr:C1 family peptidase [Bacteroidales bacterium]